MLSQDQTTLEISTTGQGLLEITDQVQSWIQQTGIKTGEVTIYCRHTSASLTIQAALTDVSLTIPVTNGRAVLGTWQGIYLFEHRHAPHHRQITLHLIGEE